MDSEDVGRVFAPTQRRSRSFATPPRTAAHEAGERWGLSITVAHIHSWGTPSRATSLHLQAASDGGTSDSSAS